MGRSGSGEKIDLRLGPAVETLQQLHATGEVFDFAFIDADKPNYGRYYELVLPMMRQGGLIVMDNMLQRGRVADPAAQEPNTLSMRELNAKLLADERVTLSLLPIGDGMTFLVKR